MTTEAVCKPVTTAAAWRGDEIKAGEEWIYHLSPEQVEELEDLGARFVEADDYETIPIAPATDLQHHAGESGIAIGSKAPLLIDTYSYSYC